MSHVGFHSPTIVGAPSSPCSSYTLTQGATASESHGSTKSVIVLCNGCTLKKRLTILVMAYAKLLLVSSYIQSSCELWQIKYTKIEYWLAKVLVFSKGTFAKHLPNWTFSLNLPITLQMHTKVKVFFLGLKVLLYPFLLQELTKREVEYIALSRDTTESDLKQRREIRSGTAFYIDQVSCYHTTLLTFVKIKPCS